MWVQVEHLSVSLFIVLNINISFNFCARFGFNVIWFAKCMKITKLKIEIISIWQNSFIDTIHCRVSPLSYTMSNKTICLKLSANSFAQFLYLTKRISDWHHFCKYKILQLILHVEVSVRTMQLTLSKAIMQVTTSVAFMQVLRWYFLLRVCWWIFLLQLCS